MAGAAARPTGYGDSPYQSFSSFAGNPLLISVERLLQAGWLHPGELAELRALPGSHVLFGELIPLKTALLQRAARRFLDAGADSGFSAFVQEQAHWLEDFVLFMALKQEHGGGSWQDWPAELRSRQEQPLAAARERHAGLLQELKVLQYWFFSHWQTVRERAHQLDITIIGDLPIFVALDSADTWAACELFDLDGAGRPNFIAGVPPDYFSATGQRWGNPLYLGPPRGTRIRLVDRAGQEQPASLRPAQNRPLPRFRSVLRHPRRRRDSAERGVAARPGQALFTALEQALGGLPVIAEDLGSSRLRSRRCVTPTALKACGCCSSRSAATRATRTCRTTTCRTVSSTPERTTTTRRWLVQLGAGTRA